MAGSPPGGCQAHHTLPQTMLGTLEAVLGLLGTQVVTPPDAETGLTGQSNGGYSRRWVFTESWTLSLSRQADASRARLP